MLEIETIIGSLPYGNSQPIRVIADDGKVYVLKFRKDNLNAKDRSNTNEYLAYKLIEHFNLKVAPQKLAFINIDDIALSLAEKSDTLSELSLSYFKASKGINIAIEFIENCEKAEKDEINHLSFMKSVKTIDHILLNSDRTLDNTNILQDKTHKEKYYAIDWGLSLSRAELYRDVKKGDINNRFMWYCHVDDVTIPEYIFRDIQGCIALNIEGIEDIIREILNGIPTEWETHFCINDIIAIVTSRIQNKLKGE